MFSLLASTPEFGLEDKIIMFYAQFLPFLGSAVYTLIYWSTPKDNAKHMPPCRTQIKTLEITKIHGIHTGSIETLIEII